MGAVAILPSISWWQALVAPVIIYLATLAFYRLFLHPLARFPGPKLAAASRWYEAYYDVVQNGQYAFQIKEMHKKYGKSHSASCSYSRVILTLLCRKRSHCPH